MVGQVGAGSVEATHEGSVAGLSWKDLPQFVAVEWIDIFEARQGKNSEIC